MDTFHILFAIDGLFGDKINSCKESLNSYNVNVNSVHSAQNKNEIMSVLKTYPDINVIIVSEQLNGDITIEDLKIFNGEMSRIIVPIINSNKRGNSEAIGLYFNNCFFNILFSNSATMKEVAEILLYGRTEETAKIYAGLIKGKLKKNVKQVKLQKKSLFFLGKKVNDSSKVNFTTQEDKIVTPNRPLQSIFSETSITIAFCGSDKESGCTTSAISAANFIAANGYNVAVIEPNFTKSPSFHKLIPNITKKEMITYKNVDYYPNWDLSKVIYSADVIVLDFSRMNDNAIDYFSKIKKLFICSGTDIMDLAQLRKFTVNNQYKYSILFKECSQTELNSLKNEFQCYSISKANDVFKDCALELKSLVQVTLLRYGINIDISNKTNLNRQRNTPKKNVPKKFTNPQSQSKLSQDYIYSDLNMNDVDLLEIPVPIPVSVPVIVPTPAQEPILKSSEIDFQKENKIIEEKVENKYSNVEPNVLSSINKAVAAEPMLIDTDPIQSHQSSNSTKVKKAVYNTISSTKQDNSTLNDDSLLRDKCDMVSNSTDIPAKTNTTPFVATNSKQNINKNQLTSPTAAATAARNVLNFLISKALKIKPEKDIHEKNSNQMKVVNDKYMDTCTKLKTIKKAENDSVIDNVITDGRLDILNYAKKKPVKRQTTNQVICGKQTIFITGLKRGCGCSHTSISFARYILNNYAKNLCICHKKDAYELNDKNIAEYTKDIDYENVFGNNSFIIYDCGALGCLNQEQLIELKRSTIKIMVCNEDDNYLGNLSKFIRQIGNASDEWIFAFNLVTNKEKESTIRKIMQGYKICFIPLHDQDNPPKKVIKIWDAIVKRNLL